MARVIFDLAGIHNASGKIIGSRNQTVNTYLVMAALKKLKMRIYQLLKKSHMNNFLSHLETISTKKKKRLGRGLGSGRGAKSGREPHDIRKARENIPLGFEGGQGDLHKRFPLLRGKEKINQEKAIIMSFISKTSINLKKERRLI